MFTYPDILAEMTSEVTTRDVKMEYLGILKEVKTFFRELVVFVNDNFVCSLVDFLEYKSFLFNIFSA